MTGYVRNFNENSTMSFRIKDKQLLKNYSKLWKKVENLLNIDFESKPIYDNDDKYIKTKVKIYAIIQLQIFITKKYQKKKHHANVYQ